MPGSSLEGKAFLRSHKILSSKALRICSTKPSCLKPCLYSKVTVNFVLLKLTNKDKPAALTSYEHLGVRLCSIMTYLLHATLITLTGHIFGTFAGTKGNRVRIHFTGSAE